MAPISNGFDPKLSRAALVIGSMIGSGIFALPASFGRATGALGAVIAWAIAGIGMLMLALMFQTLSRRKPDPDAGIYAYARAGFGDYLGFASAAGYWIGCCLADVARLILIKATLGQCFPIFGDGTTPTAIAAASALLRLETGMDRRDLRGQPAGSQDRMDPLGDGDNLHRRHDLRGWPQISSVRDPVCTRNIAVPARETRTEAADIQAYRGWCVCRDLDRGVCRSLRPRDRSHFNLIAGQHRKETAIWKLRIEAGNSC